METKVGDSRELRAEFERRPKQVCRHGGNSSLDGRGADRCWATPRLDSGPRQIDQRRTHHGRIKCGPDLKRVEVHDLF
jgi:hypothetical protein